MTKQIKYGSVFFFIVCFLIILRFIVEGPDDIEIINQISEKMTTINFSIAIGYAAIMVAVAGLASHNNKQDKKLKSNVMLFIFSTIVYIFLNLIIFLAPYMTTPEYSIAIMERILIGLMIVLLLMYSYLLLLISVKLIY